MARGWNRVETWLALVVVGVGGLLAAISGLHVYVTATATRLHPEPSNVPSTLQSEPKPQWMAAADRARAVMRAGISEQNLPGLSVAVGVGGEIVWAEGFGWADLDGQAPVDPATQFRIGTASIALTSAAAGLLLEQGRLNLDDEIQVHVPEYPKKPWPVTLRQLMAHTAGVKTDGGDEGPLFGQHCDHPVEALPVFADAALRFEPGTQFSPSSYGWILVSAAIEEAANEPFLRFMRDRVFEPLGMEATRPDPAAERTAGRATPYFPRYSADPRYGLHLMRQLDHSCYAGASVFLSTPSDLVRFGMAMNGGTLLRPETVRLLQTSQQLRSGEETGYGLGWNLETVTLGGEQVRAVGHDGAVLGGMAASLLILPERGIAVAVTSNISYADTATLASGVADAFVSRAGAAPTD